MYHYWIPKQRDWLSSYTCNWVDAHHSLILHRRWFRKLNDRKIRCIVRSWSQGSSKAVQSSTLGVTNPGISDGRYLMWPACIQKILFITTLPWKQWMRGKKTSHIVRVRDTKGKKRKKIQKCTACTEAIWFLFLYNLWAKSYWQINHWPASKCDGCP